ncbi:putative phage tail assembly protein, P2 GpU family [Pseudogulbenkiania sp. NH8B]|uniref:phage tail protein n=1 Tax=Pseudogulbenkiania sp. (strain NH8B) TaxID=748280 RepID=UPI00022794F6|nr:phage tail protein [Pseudogulbenkiania sp. NH8B]BAK75382.1 putative phage tail assembly protein, P2 GpU family [Pseudogulbenkiania sp. NH8B]
MFALLGEIQFELITHFDGLEINRATKYARHEVLDGKPILQRTGEELDELTIELAFHEYYCDPEAELKKLDEARRAGKSMPLIWGHGVIEGQFVIEKIRVTEQTATQFGKVTSLSASVSLLEYVEPKLLEAATREKRKAAPGRKQKGKAGSKKTPGAKTSRAGTATVKNKDGVEFTKITRN